MSASRTQTTTTISLSTAGPLRSRQTLPVPASPANHKDEDLAEDEEEILRRAQEKVRRMKERKAVMAVKKKAEEEVARKAAEEAQKQKEAAARELEERRKRMAEAAMAHSWRGSSPGETSMSPQRPVVEIRKEKGKGKAKALGPISFIDIPVISLLARIPMTMRMNGRPASALRRPSKGQHIPPPHQLEVGLVDDGRSQKEEFAARNAGARAIRIAEEEKEGN
ncbi:hypothetical protein EV359DRAFT_86623 [Lentinula novae-zelandiae]|nr:hypothetical protein EV359DRAFT_86623 [Lentinula novae-zelandiae]